MGEPARPMANRLQRPSWRDSRLIIGVLLVVASLILGSVVVAGADDRVPVWAAARHLAPGESIEAGDLVRSDVRIDAVSDLYVPVTESLEERHVVTREVRPGELMPRTAVGSADSVDVRLVHLPVDQASARMLTQGSTVTVWASVRGGGASAPMGRPKVVLQDVTVAAVPEAKGMLGGGDTAGIRLLIDRRDVRDVADLVAKEARFFVSLGQDSPVGEPR